MDLLIERKVVYATEKQKETIRNLNDKLSRSPLNELFLDNLTIWQASTLQEDLFDRVHNKRRKKRKVMFYK